MTIEELQLARAAQWEALRPAEMNPANLLRLVRDLGFATLPELAEWAGVEGGAGHERRLAALHELLDAAIAAAQVVELELWPGTRRYVPAELLGYIYVAVGDRHPRQDYKKQAERRQLSWLAAEVYERLLEAKRAFTAAELRDQMGAERTSALGIERALAELAVTLKVVRVGREGGSQWRPLVSVLPGVPAAVDAVSLVEAAAALVTQWLDVMICDTEENIAAFFSPLFSRSRIRAALAGLEATHEVVLGSLDGRHSYRLKTVAAG